MRFQSYSVPLSGTAPSSLNLATPMRSITIIPLTSSVTVQVRPGDLGDSFNLQLGRSVTLGDVPGEDIAPTTLRLNAASAVTVDVVVAFP